DVRAVRVLEGRPARGRHAAVLRMVRRHHARVRGGELVDLRPGAVVAAVVDEDDLARDAAPVEDALGAIDELGQVPLLVEAGNEDAQIDAHGLGSQTKSACTRVCGVFGNRPSWVMRKCSSNNTRWAARDRMKSPRSRA